MTGRSSLLLITGALLVTCIVAGLIILRQLERRTALDRRVQLIRQGIDLRANPAGLTVAGLVAGFGNALARSGLLPAGTLAELEATLSSAATGGNRGLALFLGAKVLLAFGMLVVSIPITGRLTLPTMLHYVLPGAAALAGMVLPDYVIKNWRKRYLGGVEAGLPDALDMLVICSEAGLGLEPAIERVGEELGQVHPAMAREMRLTAQELQISSDRREALQNMGARTDLECLRRLASTLIQTMQFGTPLTQAMRTLAAEMRQENMTRYEGRAAKLPVLLTFPMILFILPCVFIVVGAPAVLRALSALGKH